MEADPERLCPKCAYSLKGLPVVHTCPECGSEYDPHALVIRFDVQQYERRQMGYATILLAMIGFVSFRAGIQQDDILLLVIIAGSMLTSLVKMCRARSTPYLLSINRCGVQFEHPKLRERRLLWSTIDRAKFRWLSGRFYLYGDDGKKLISIRPHWIGGRRVARMCATRINSLAQIYSDVPRGGNARD